MIQQEIIAGLKNRYPDLHPLIFHRSAEKAYSPGELFDILEGIPNEYPIVWNEQERRWIYTLDVTQAEKFNWAGEK